MKYKIEMQPLAGRTVVACKDPQTGVVIRALVLNASAAEMLRLRLEGLEVPDIAHLLSERYGVDPARITADATALFEKFAI
jgi:hypothetical protein